MKRNNTNQQNGEAIASSSGHSAPRKLSTCRLLRWSTHLSSVRFRQRTYVLPSFWCCIKSGVYSLSINGSYSYTWVSSDTFCWLSHKFYIQYCLFFWILYMGSQYSIYLFIYFIFLILLGPTCPCEWAHVVPFSLWKNRLWWILFCLYIYLFDSNIYVCNNIIIVLVEKKIKNQWYNINFYVS